MVVNRLIQFQPRRRYVGMSACLMGLLCLTPAMAGQPAPGSTAEGSAQLREDADTLLKGNRSVLAKVLAISSDQIKVDVGEVQPRFLPLKQAHQKGFPALAEGDDVVVVLNEQNLLVDYHPVDGELSAHTVIRGEIAQNLPVGQETVVVRSAGEERSYQIRSQVRSKVAAIAIGTTAIFLLDESNQIADVALSTRQNNHDSGNRHGGMSPIKGAHQQVDGTVVSPLTANRITLRTGTQAEQPFEVRETTRHKLESLRKGDAVILLIDTDNKVIDVAIPPRKD
ncbi:MAG: hypothetical protein H8K06_17080 [Nitrospira sp.]|uniref:DUF5666 domain-containing protein n=1 Tax=Nitrospira defluvii TaxID=330214 RepID=A0ABM8R1V1_9BACT|nr:hypothetical protein [Nitrospira defluvii]MCS6328781.1 hypothetical protein [Nitrospira sp.]CAE6728283.1 conserved exported hypothetical protein [Nitrospira defluvii]